MPDFWIGIFTGAMVVLALLGISPKPELDAYNKAISQCEENLQRNEHCVITALPIKKGE